MNTTLRRALAGAPSSLILAAALLGALLAPQRAHADQGAYAQVLCANPDTGLGVSGTGVQGLSSPAGSSSWQAPVTLANCGWGLPMDEQRAITLQASRDENWAPGTYGALHYAVTQPGVRLLGGTIYRALRTKPSSPHGYMAVSQHGGLDPANAFALPQNNADSGDWRASASMSRGTLADPFAAENAVWINNGTQQNQWNVTAACEPQGAATACAQTAGEWRYLLFGGRMTLLDDSAPQATNVNGNLKDADVIPPTATIGFSANDVGSGIYRIIVNVDGAQVLSRIVPDIDGNTDPCQDVNPANADPHEFYLQTPCPATIADYSTSWATNSVPDGHHALKVTLQDAGGNDAVLVDRYVQFDQHPNARLDPDSPPTISGTPQVGSTLTGSLGSWTYDRGYWFQWERCDAMLRACAAIPQATTPTYRPTAEDVGYRLWFAVTVANSNNETTRAVAQPTQAVAAAPAASAPPPAEAPSGASEPSPTPQPTSAAATPPAPGALGSPSPSLSLTAIPSAANGANASRSARLQIRLAGRGTTLRTRFPSRVRLSGSLSDDTGRAITGATVRVIARDAAAGAPAQAPQTALTDEHGDFALTLAAGASRSVRVTYRAFAQDAADAAAATARIIVPAEVTLAVSRARVGRTTWMTGRLRHLPRAGIQIQVQALDGRRWRTFDTTRTQAAGRYRFGYRFKPTAAHRTFHLRVLVESPVYPFARGASRAVAVTVGP